MKKYLPIDNENSAYSIVLAVLFNKKLAAFAAILLLLAASFNASAGKITHWHKTNKKASAGANLTGPTVSYSSPKAIVAGVPITSITPTSSGVATFAFNKLPVTIASGLPDVWGAVDKAGNVFQLQLPGTYFYSLDYTVNRIVKHKTGFIILKY